MKHLKTFFAFMLMAVLSIGQMWATDFSWNLATNSYSSSSTSTVVWSNTNATMTLDKGKSSTNANNYLGGTSNYTHTRMYASQVLTFAPTSGITISKVEITATSSTYAGYFTNATWSNATASTSSSVSTITPTDGTKSFSGTIGTATRATSVKVYYSTAGSNDPTPLSVPTGMSSGTPGTTSATLTWNAVTNADGYALTIGNNTPITTGFTTSNGKVSYALSNLTADTDYTWKVKATTTHTDTYSNSDDCDDQTFTTADDPSYSKVTYDFTNASNYPSGFPTSSGTSTESATDFTFGGNTLKLYAPDAYYQMTSGTSKVLFFGKTTGAYIEFPAKAGYKLIKVKVTNSSACAVDVPVNIFSTTGTAMSTAVKTAHDGVMSFALASSAYNTAYRITSTTNNKNLQFAKIILTYKPQPTVSSISIKTAPTKTNYTANENFDPSGLVITVNYSDNTSEDVAYGNTTASDFTFSPSTSTALNATNTSVTVTYGTKTANQAITVNRIATTLAWSAASYSANIGASYSFPTLTKTPAALEGVTFSSSNTAVVETFSSAGVPTVKGTGTTTITAAFTQTNVYAAATSASYTLTINEASSPSLEVDPTSITFALTAVGANKTEIVTLVGEYLAANATYEITGDDKAMFSVVDPAFPLTPDEGELLEDITIKYAPTEASENHTATLTITSGVASATVTLSGSAKVKRTVKWYKADDTELTAAERGTATTEVWDGDAVTVLPNSSALSSCDASISFQGWTNEPYAKDDNAPTVLFTDADDAPAVSGGDAKYYAVWASASGDNGSVVINAQVDGYPTTYGSKNAFDDLEVSGFDFKIQQLTTSSYDMQWRAYGNSNGTGTIYNDEAFPGHISSVVVVFTSSDTNKNHTLKIGDSANPTSGTSITPSVSNTYTYTFDCSAYNFDYFVLENGSNAGYTSSVTINYAASIKDYSTICSVPVEIKDPTFSPAAGSFDDDQNVTISAESGMTIYYSFGAESNPKTSGTAYTSAISVTEDKVIKAVATDGNGNWSNVVTKTYSINYSTSIAAFIAKAQSTSRTLKLSAAQNCIITGIREYTASNTTKYDLYIQDASNNGVVVYGLTALPEGVAEGKRIEGSFSGTYVQVTGQHRITSADFTNATFKNADALTPAAITAVDETAYNANPMMLVKLSGVYYNSGSYYFTSQAAGQGTSNHIYDSFKKFDGKTMPANTVACDITGVIVKYVSGNTTDYELIPYSLTTAATAALPTISPVGGADAKNALEVTYLSEISVGSVENEDITIKLNDVEKTDANPILVQGDLKLEVIAKRDFYADNSVTYYYKPSAYPKNIDVTSAHGTVVVKVGDNVVETALPTSTVNVTISDIESHFTLTGVEVKDADNANVSVTENAGVYSFEMPNNNVTITANYLEDTHYTITYSKGNATGGSAPEGAETWQYAGETITLLANAYTWDADHSFTGWKVSYGETEVIKAVGQTFEMPEANVTITAQWEEKQYCKLTLKVNGADYLVKNIEQDVKQTISALEGYEDPEDVGDYEFIGWAEDEELDDVEDAIVTIDAFTPTDNLASKTLYAVFKRTVTGANKTDVLTAADLAATGTGYVEFSNVQKNSNAKYAGKTAKNGTSNIQINKKAENGIYSSVSGGKLVSVTIAMTSNSNALGIYASNTAYTGYTGIPSQSGSTEIGTLANETSKTITPNSDYKYVGVASKTDGAKYIQSISITWQSKTTYYTTNPAVVYDVTYNLGTNPDGAWKANEGCDDAKVKSGLTYNICEDEPVREHHKFNGWTVGGNAASGTITITGNTEITANWIAKVENDITYNAGTGIGSNIVVENVEEGTEVTLKAIGTGEGKVNFTKSGYDFKGWKYNNKLYAAGETIEMPASAVSFVAQWKKQNTEKYVLVTDASQLVNGAKVILANQEAEAVAGESAEETGTFMTNITAGVTFNNDKTQLTAFGDGIQLTLVQMENGWALQYDGKYMEPVTSKNQINWKTTPTTWTIVSNTDSTIISSGSKALRYNNTNNQQRFSAYSLTGQKPIQLYANMTAITSNTTTEDLGYVDGDILVVNEGVTLTVNTHSEPKVLVVKDGATVNITAQTNTDNLFIDNGGIVDVTDGTLATNDFVIGATEGKSGQLIGTNVAATSLSIEIKLIDGDMDAEASRNWYCISAPFDVAFNGGFFWGDGTPMVYNVDFQLFEYDGEKRANSGNGWKRVSGNKMNANKAHFIGFDDERSNQNTIRLKAMSTVIPTATSIALGTYPGDDANANWNGVANPTLHYVALDKSVSLFDVVNQIFNTYASDAYSFVVGAPLFVQSTGSINLSNDDHGQYYAPQRSREDNYSYCVRISKPEATRFDNQMYVRASENATASFEQDHDMASLNGTTSSRAALVWTENYNMRLAIQEAPLNNNTASYVLGLSAPKAGEYILSVTDEVANASLYLTYNGSIIWDLSASPFTITLNQGVNYGYGLLMQVNAPHVATGVDNADDALNNLNVKKIILNEHVYILRDGQLFDITGKIAK